MSNWSVVIGILGICGTGVWTVYHSRQRPHYVPLRYWSVGFAALLPAWLLAFVGLLGSPSGQGVGVTLPLPALFSSGVGLLGIVLTDALVRRLHASRRAHHPMIYWLLGLVAFVPAWCIALLGLLRR